MEVMRKPQCGGPRAAREWRSRRNWIRGMEVEAQLEVATGRPRAGGRGAPPKLVHGGQTEGQTCPGVGTSIGVSGN